MSLFFFPVQSALVFCKTFALLFCLEKLAMLYCLQDVFKITQIEFHFMIQRKYELCN